MITLFTTDCPKCKVLKAKLDSKNIEYTVSDDITLLESLGFMSVPVLKVREKYLNFMESVDFVNNY